MSPKILLLGPTGQVGSELCMMLPRLGQMIALDRQQLDLSDSNKIRDAVRAISPQIIVNAAAYTAVDRAETDEATAEAINMEASKVLGNEAGRLRALLIHYSTDYVFDGTKRVPYVEADNPNPQNVYGRTKLLGEKAIQESGALNLIFRTAWVYGRRGRNFLLTILKLAAQQEELKIVDDQVGAPTWSREIAAATMGVISQICTPDGTVNINPSDCGIYHMTAAGETTWYAFAKAILEQASDHPPSDWLTAAIHGGPLIARRIRPISTKDYPTPARRPAYSVLSNARLDRVFKVRLPDWRTQLSSCFAD